MFTFLFLTQNLLFIYEWNNVLQRNIYKILESNLIKNNPFFVTEVKLI